ncbi:MAG TPA: ABC transporter ATP-binding protein [Ktedonosporobacter sp.]|nr:ABC transporter ATP-binding protein [Ktedonosporobacter sp.]
MERIQTLVMRDVTRRFGTTTALHSFDLALEGGQFTTLLGPSGCGKSTALNCLAGLLELSGGEILLNGEPIQHLPAEKRGFGMVFQNYALFPHLNVMRNVAYGLEIRGVARAEREKRVRRALAQVHLEGLEKRYPAQLSGGQQQRLAIARTIVLEPGLLLLDEPLSNLDANLRNEMRIEIKRLHEELGLTTLYVTHDQTEAMSLSDRVVVMRLGHIEQVGTPQDIYNAPGSLFVAGFMGYANRLSVELIGKEGSYWSVQTSTGLRLQARSTRAQSEHWQVGQRVLALFKPDETLADPLPPSNHMRGRVKLIEYMGKSFEVLVLLEGDESTQLLVQSSQTPESGSLIEFGIRPERLLLFSQEDIPALQITQETSPTPALQGER